MIGSSGELIVLGVNFRVYDSAKQVWNIKWLNALEGKWTDLTSEQFGGARFDGQSVTYAFKSSSHDRQARFSRFVTSTKYFAGSTSSWELSS